MTGPKRLSRLAIGLLWVAIITWSITVPVLDILYLVRLLS